MKKLFLAIAAVAMVFATSCSKENVNSPDDPTPPDNSSDVTHEYVDLGLSVKWATCNVGANNPWEHGDYFAWGETSTKVEYNQLNYKHYFYGGYHFLKGKYNEDDGKTVLESVDDAATARWGGNWRMPTEAEFSELSNNCTWTWTTNYNNTGIPGYIGYSKIPGYTDKSIFLPVTGRYEMATLCYGNAGGYYWSSTRSNQTSKFGYLLYARYFYFDSGELPDVHTKERWQGMPVRPVCP